MHIEHYINPFTSLEDTTFCPKEYSRMKFGDDWSANKFGVDLADSFFEAYSDRLLSDKCLVIPSPYNYVKNAATVITGHFVNRINSKLYEFGKSLDYSIIHRKVSYTADYGFLPKEKRKSLLSNDLFYLNKDYLKGKTLIFLDDVKITGTHEDKLKEILDKKKMNGNGHFFLYCAKYFGEHPDIESKINFAAVQSTDDYVDLINNQDSNIIIRSIKYILSQDDDHFDMMVDEISPNKLREIYNGAIAEGYYKIPQYQENCAKLHSIFK